MQQLVMLVHWSFILIFVWLGHSTGRLVSRGCQQQMTVWLSDWQTDSAECWLTDIQVYHQSANNSYDAKQLSRSHYTELHSKYHSDHVFVSYNISLIYRCHMLHDLHYITSIPLEQQRYATMSTSVSRSIADRQMERETDRQTCRKADRQRAR